MDNTVHKLSKSKSDTLYFLQKHVVPYVKAVIPNEIWGYIEEYGVIAGGAIRDSMLYSIEDIKDIDIFFKRDSTKFLTEFFNFDMSHNDLIIISKNAIVLSKFNMFLQCGDTLLTPQIQLIQNFNNVNRERIISQFDISVCKTLYDLKRKELMFDEDFYKVLQDETAGNSDIRSISFKAPNSVDDSIRVLIRLMKILGKKCDIRQKPNITDMKILIKNLVGSQLTEEEVSNLCNQIGY